MKIDFPIEIRKIKKTNDIFVIDNKTLIRTSIEFKKEAEYLKNLIEGSSFFKPKIIYDTQSELANVISLEKTTDVNNQIKEYYYLSTGNNRITIIIQSWEYQNNKIIKIIIIIIESSCDNMLL